MHEAEKSGLKRIRQMDTLQNEKYSFLSEMAKTLLPLFCMMFTKFQTVWAGCPYQVKPFYVCSEICVCQTLRFRFLI